MKNSIQVAILGRKIFLGILTILSFTLNSSVIRAASNTTVQKRSKSKRYGKTKGKVSMLNFMETNNDTPERELNHRLRLDASHDTGVVLFGSRIDIKGITGAAQGDDLELENIRTFVGPGKFAITDELSFNPRFELWLPTNEQERNEDGLRVHPGVSGKVEINKNRNKFSYELNGRKPLYQDNSDGSLKDFEIFSELKAQLPIKGKFAFKGKFKVKDSWTKDSAHEQKYELFKGLAYSVTKSFSVEIGHLIKRTLLSKSGSKKSFKLFDGQDSNIYTEVIWAI